MFQSNDNRDRDGVVGRQGVTHHCYECKKPVADICFTKGHVAYCEVRDCGHRFNARFGCIKHKYVEDYNQAAKAKFKGLQYTESNIVALDRSQESHPVTQNHSTAGRGGLTVKFLEGETSPSASKAKTAKPDKRSRFLAMFEKKSKKFSGSGKKKMSGSGRT